MIFLDESAACERIGDRKYGWAPKGNQQNFIHFSKDQNVGQSYRHTLWMDTSQFNVQHGSITTGRHGSGQVLPARASDNSVAKPGRRPNDDVLLSRRAIR